MGPVSEPQWTEEAEGRRRPGPNQSVLSFATVLPSSSLTSKEGNQPSKRPGKGVLCPGAEWRCSHPSNKSHHGCGTTERAAAQTSFVPCCQLSRLASAISMGNDVMVVIIHPSRPIPICVFELGGRTKVSASNVPHTQSGVISTQRFFSVHYNKQCEWECVGGGQGTSSTMLRYRTRTIMSFQDAPDKCYIIRRAHTPLKLSSSAETGCFSPSARPR